MITRTTRSLSSRPGWSRWPRRKAGAANTQGVRDARRGRLATQALTLVAPRETLDKAGALGVVRPPRQDQEGEGVKGTLPGGSVSPASPLSQQGQRFGGLTGSRPAPTGLCFLFLLHRVQTGFSPLLSPLGLRRVGEGVPGSLMGCEWQVGVWRGAPGTSSSGKARGQTGTAGLAPASHPAARLPPSGRRGEVPCDLLGPPHGAWTPRGAHDAFRDWVPEDSAPLKR